MRLHISDARLRRRRAYGSMRLHRGESIMGGLKWMGAVAVAAALLCAGASAWARDEYYKGCINCQAIGVSTCRTIPHYPNAKSYEPYDSNYDMISARTETTDNAGAVEDWFKAHLGPGWTYHPPAPGLWPPTPQFSGPGGWIVEIDAGQYPVAIRFFCEGG
jgi:hypothetical protein